MWLHGAVLRELEALKRAGKPSPATAAQPAPRPMDSSAVWPLVIRDVELGTSGAPERCQRIRHGHVSHARKDVDEFRSRALRSY